MCHKPSARHLVVASLPLSPIRMPINGTVRCRERGSPRLKRWLGKSEHGGSVVFLLAIGIIAVHEEPS